MRKTLIFWLLLLSTFTFGHGESEMFYSFDFAEQKTLRIDLTTSTALAILFSEKPELEKGELVNITAHADLLENYFNRSIQLKFGEQVVNFNYLKSDFSIHDSYVLFAFESKKMKGSYRLMINALCDLYRTPTNGVKIIESESTKEYWLNCHQNLIQGEIREKPNTVKLIAWIIAILIGGGLVTLLLWKKNFLQRNHQSVP